MPLLGRILCVTSNFPRWEGDSTTPFVLHLAQDLQALGWKIDVLAPHAPQAAKEETLSGVHIERFRYLLPESQQTVCYQGGALINLRDNPFNKLKLPVLVGAEIYAVAQRLFRRNYDLLHSHWILPQGFAGMIARTVKRTPHVVTVHGSDIFSLKARSLVKLKAVTLSTADAVTVNSSYTEKAVRDLVPRLENLRRIPMGVSTTGLNERQAMVAKEIRARFRRGNGPLLLFVGRIVDEKGVEDLLHASRILAERLRDATVLIVGDGQDRQNLERLSAQMGLNGRVIFTGWADPSDVLAYLSAADIFVGPSRRTADGRMEAQGLTFLEAMVAGTPVVATRSGGIVDSVKHEETGLLVDERSPAQIAAAVLRLTQDPVLARELTDHARLEVLRGFSREASAMAFSTLFSSLVRRTDAEGKQRQVQ